MNERVAGLLFKIRADTTALRTGLNQSKTAVSGLQKTITGLGAALGVTFGIYSVKKIAETVISLIKLGGEIKGVEEAFSRINQPDLLSNLRKATRGLVDDVDLMKIAIKAENFRIPLQNLATYFEFATKRATQTGESVQDLMDIIVSGVGKQSLKVVKGIGLSVDEWKKTFKETGNFAQTAIIMMTKEIENMGEVTKTEAQNVESIKIAWKNVKDAVAIEITGGGGINESLDELAKKIQGTAEFIGSDKFDSLVSGFKEVWKWTNRINVEYQITLGLLRGWKTLITGIGRIGGGGEKTTTPGKKATLGGGTISRPNLTYVPRTASQLLPETLGKPEYTDPLAMLSGWDVFTKGYKEDVARIEESSKHMTEIFQGVGKASTDLSDMIRSTFLEIANIIGNAIESAFAGDSFKDIGKESLASMGKFMRQMGMMMLTYGLAAKAFRLALTNPGALIAIGATMIALGSAIAGLASRGVSGAGGGGGTGMIRGGGGGVVAWSPIKVQTESIVKGNDLYLINKRYSNYRNATT